MFKKNKTSKFNLLHCPMCGGEAELRLSDVKEISIDRFSVIFYVCCKGCHVTIDRAYEFEYRTDLKEISGVHIIRDERAKAANDWNERVNKEGKDNG